MLQHHRAWRNGYPILALGLPAGHMRAQGDLDRHEPRRGGPLCRNAA
jgi:hypothetical protein